VTRFFSKAINQDHIADAQPYSVTAQQTWQETSITWASNLLVRVIVFIFWCCIDTNTVNPYYPTLIHSWKWVWQRKMYSSANFPLFSM